MAEEKKNIFKKIGDALSNRDEKEAAAKAAAEAAAKAAEAAAEAKAKMEEIAKAKAEAEAKKQDLLEAQARYAREAEARKAEQEARKAAEEEAKKKAIIATHVVKSGETLSHIALQYYKHATPPYYKLIYEFNKDVIGDNINIIIPGQELRIPVLPEELK
jgi:nucleoid-associated protein YgaU